MGAAPSRTAVHEAGHAVASWALGFTEPGATTVVPFGHVGGLCVAGVPPNAEANIVCSLAGEEAVRLFEHGDNPDRPAAQWAPDSVPIEERLGLAVVYRGPESDVGDDAWTAWSLAIENDWCERFDELEARTRTLLVEHAPRVLALAGALDEHGTLSAAHWRGVVESAQDRPDGRAAGGPTARPAAPPLIGVPTKEA